MTAQDPNFFIVLLLGAGVLYDLIPALFPAAAILCMLWLLASHTLIAIGLAVLWCLRGLVADFFVALVAGFGGGLGLRLSGVFKRGRR